MVFGARAGSTMMAIFPSSRYSGVSLVINEACTKESCPGLNLDLKLSSSLPRLLRKIKVRSSLARWKTDHDIAQGSSILFLTLTHSKKTASWYDLAAWWRWAQKLREFGEHSAGGTWSTSILNLDLASDDGNLVREQTRVQAIEGDILR